ncbi:hypothetical protein Zmor_009412 [Zophobas morio]|uniref:Uncharacterized protein n=1 Tax=Zophobas morio TaxID=2755281 RepID=A0AA38IL35_9CUCU|nr:hypothetical protein Zmor_009412 [Zophobas morio]
MGRDLTDAGRVYDTTETFPINPRMTTRLVAARLARGAPAPSAHAGIRRRQLLITAERGGLIPPPAAARPRIPVARQIVAEAPTKIRTK